MVHMPGRHHRQRVDSIMQKMTNSQIELALICATLAFTFIVVSAPQTRANSNGDDSPPGKVAPIFASVTKIDKKKGAKTSAAQKQFEEWNKPLRGWHPLVHIVRPIWKSTVDLEKRLETMEAPMDQLQPTVLALDERIKGLDSKMGLLVEHLSSINAKIPELSKGMSGVDSNLSGMQKNMRELQSEVHEAALVRKDLHELIALRLQVTDLKEKIHSLQSPLQDLQDPMKGLASPLKGVQEKVENANKQLDLIETRLVSMQSNFGALSRQIESLDKDLKGLQSSLVSSTECLPDLRGDLKTLNATLSATVQGIQFLAIAIIAAIPTFYLMLARLASTISPNIEPK